MSRPRNTPTGCPGNQSSSISSAYISPSDNNGASLTCSNPDGLPKSAPGQGFRGGMEDSGLLGRHPVPEGPPCRSPELHPPDKRPGARCLARPLQPEDRRLQPLPTWGGPDLDLPAPQHWQDSNLPQGAGSGMGHQACGASFREETPKAWQTWPGETHLLCSSPCKDRTTVSCLRLRAAQGNQRLSEQGSGQRVSGVIERPGNCRRERGWPRCTQLCHSTDHPQPRHTHSTWEGALLRRRTPDPPHTEGRLSGLANSTSTWRALPFLEGSGLWPWACRPTPRLISTSQSPLECVPTRHLIRALPPISEHMCLGKERRSVALEVLLWAGDRETVSL